MTTSDLTDLRTGAVAPRYADPTDVARWGAYTIASVPGDTRPLYRFAGRITTDGSSPFPAEPGRYHLYSGWFCPWAHRAVIVRELKGLQDVVSLSYVDNTRDARGWAFREATGPDPVNGFTFLREAYEATEPGFDGHVSVPTLWDRVSATIVTNSFADITIDFATAFEQWSTTGLDTYPVALRPEIDALNEWLLVEVNRAVGLGAATGDDAERARRRFWEALGELDSRLRTRRFLHGDQVSESDVRLWVTLVRLDVASNAAGELGPRRLSDFPALWAYARDLYRLPAFRDTTDFSSFVRPGAVVPDWNEVPDRA